MVNTLFPPEQFHRFVSAAVVLAVLHIRLLLSLLSLLLPDDLTSLASLVLLLDAFVVPGPPFAPPPVAIVPPVFAAALFAAVLVAAGSAELHQVEGFV